MESLVIWYQNSLGSFMPKEVFIFLVSMLPLIELRGGLIIASLLKVPLVQANILLFIKKIFEFMKKHNIMKKLVYKLEDRAAKKSSGVEKGEFIFLLLFVGIPLPGTGAWTGSLIASLLEFDIKKASLAILIGLFLLWVLNRNIS